MEPFIVRNGGARRSASCSGTVMKRRAFSNRVSAIANARNSVKWH